MIANTLEQTLNGGFNGLIGEVVTHDCYRLKQLNFIADIFFDLGGNVGVTTRFARSLFPNAIIVTVEPDKENYHHLVKFTEVDDKMVLLNKAIGLDDVWRKSNAENGAHESYITNGKGSPKNQALQSGVKMEQVNVHTIMPDELINEYLKEGMKSVLKCDIEGNENVFLSHKPSIEALKKIDYIAMELHWWNRDEIFSSLKQFEATHNCEVHDYSFFATKK